jgi:ribosomal protein S18 acetylase RimI-like enzyme
MACRCRATGRARGGHIEKRRAAAQTSCGERIDKGNDMAKLEVLIRTATEADAPDIAQIHMASWRGAYRGVIPDAAIDARTVEGATEMWLANLGKFPENLTVAERPDRQIAGFSCAGPVTNAEHSAPYEFEVYALHVRPDVRQHGIGAALLHQAMARARDQLHMRSLIVWTLEDLRLSRRFYEREGGKVVKHGHWQVGGVALPELAYGWNW